MGTISIRLSKELETKLIHEAEIENKPRSEIVRQAISAYLVRRERERFMQHMVAEAREASANETIRQEIQDINEDLHPFDKGTLDDGIGDLAEKSGGSNLAR